MAQNDLDKMMNSIWRDVQAKSKKKSKESLGWLYSLAPKLTSAQVPPEAFNPKSNKQPFIGGMFLYHYDPKHKETLPWYDSLPLIIPLEIYSDGWLGLNLHYLPPKGRQMLMGKLLEYKKRSNTPKAYMQLSYSMLSSVAKTSLFGPCVHRYLGSHLKSRILRIDDQYWEKVVMLPIQKFQKASAQTVWSKT